MVPQSALNHQHNQRRLATLTAAANVRIWASMGDDFDASWSELAPRLTAVTTAGQLAAARLADPYLRAVLAETGQPNRPVAAVRARGFAGIAADGRPLTGLLAGAVIKAKLARQETSTVEALARGGRWLQLATDTTIADTARSAVTVGITNRPELDGYVRSTGSLACSRCSVLAGKFYRYSAGFLRHPRCHCINTPSTRQRAGDFVEHPELTSPVELDSLDVAARTHEGRRMPEQIVSATADRSRAIAMLRQAGFAA
jgi:hypothetical protein